MQASRLSSDLYGVLERYRIEARRQARFNSHGEHLTRKKGQSLEFEDYKPYVPGDDTRHLDLRASMRVSGHQAMVDPSKWLVREFVSEEQLRLFVSIDTHPTMRYPQIQSSRFSRGNTFSISKMQVALWLAEALSIIAFESADRLIWHPLFTNGQIASSYPVMRREAIPTVFEAIQTDMPTDTLNLNTEPLERELKPAFVWVIISDFYFTDPKRIAQLREWVLRAQRGHRWIILIDLDSWDYERALLNTGLRGIKGHNISERKVYTSDQNLRPVLDRINDNKNNILNFGMSRQTCLWDSEYETDLDFQNFFMEWFLNNAELKTLFMRNA
jgi:hypothetical protein